MRHKNWDYPLQKFALCLRSMVNATMGVSSALLNFALEITLPGHSSLVTDDKSVSFEDLKKIATSVTSSLREVLIHFRDKITRKHQINKVHHDKNRLKVSFNVGDKI